jgi:hypothetical protein|tara:strand:- start:1839 stop:2186 length:348 start_codon:yes stop_codon:yes gene_type:complete
MDGISFGRLITKKLEELGVKPLKIKTLSNKEKSNNLRKFYINFYKNHYVNNLCNCFEKRKKDIAYHLKAYETMSDEQILMSEKRKNYLNSKETSQQLKDLREFEKESRNSRIMVC